MNIALLYGNPDKNDKVFHNYIHTLSESFPQDCEIDFWDLDKMDINYCTGCWTCWYKTPGECTFNDEGVKVLKSVIQSDFVILASPLIAGFTSSTLKAISDRFVALLHPYIKFINKECHHQKRYETYPDYGLLLKKEPETSEEDLKVVKDIYDRFALNFHGSIRYITFMETNLPEYVMEATLRSVSKESVKI